MKGCGCGSTVTRLDPAACNAAQVGPGGLLVPEVSVVGVVGDIVPPVGTERSVDIDVVHTPGCPEVFTVGARLSPAHGNANVGLLNLLATPTGQGQPVPFASWTAPEAGRYRMTAHLTAQATWNFSGRHTASIAAQWRTAANALVPRSNVQVLLADEQGTIHAQGLRTITGTATSEGFATAAEGDVFTVYGVRTQGDGAAETTANVVHQLGGFQSHIFWQKVTD